MSQCMSTGFWAGFDNLDWWNYSDALNSATGDFLKL